jgi:hypothetical protein
LNLGVLLSRQRGRSRLRTFIQASYSKVEHAANQAVQTKFERDRTVMITFSEV